MLADDAVDTWRNLPDTEQEDYGPDRADQELVNALLASPPLYAGYDPILPTQRRAFGCKQEIEMALARIEDVAKRFALEG